MASNPYAPALSTSLNVVIVGRPNVGKSTLFNRLIGKAHAIVEDTPGVTRDWREGAGKIGPLEFKIIDTAGLEDAKEGSLEQRMFDTTEAVLGKADIVLFLIDGRAGVTPVDRHFAQWLRKKPCHVRVVVNKCEGNKSHNADEAYQLGFEEPICISAAHGEGMAMLYDVLAPLAEAKEASLDHPEQDGEEAEGVDESQLHIAIVGRPNAGKSTLFNALLGETRVLTGPEAGITRDAVAVDWQYGSYAIRLVDTAGMRRRSRVTTPLEKMSLDSTFRSIQYAQVVVLLLDVTLGLESQDIAIAERVLEEGRGLVIAINKADSIADPSLKSTLEEHVRNRLQQITGVEIVYISALQKQGLDALMEACERCYTQWKRRIPTSPLNEWLLEAVSKHPLPLGPGSRRVRIKYIVQHKSRPPTFLLFTSQPDAIEGHYLRYLQNSLRAAFKLPGIPLRFLCKKSKNPYVPKG